MTDSRDVQVGRWVLPGAYWLWRQAVLVPEAVLLVVLLCLHGVLGAPLPTALLGLALVGWFGCRSGLLMAARRAVDEARYERAGQLIRGALLLYPFSADAYALRGALQIARGRGGEAAADLSRATELYPGHAGLHAALAGALAEAGEPAESIRRARYALQLDPRCALAFLHLSTAEQMLGADAAATECTLREGLAVVQQPADEAALRCTLASILAGAGRHTEAALTMRGVEVLLERCPPAQRAGLHFHLGELGRALGDLDVARSHYYASERLDPHGRYAAAAWRAARS